jgi:Na+-driven multidrug efflux pump
LIDSPLAAEIARGGMYLIPLGILFGVPLFLMRPAFEGLQEPRPGLKLSVLRSLILSVPLGWAGFKVAPHVGLQELQGLLLGGALASGITSFVALNWMRQTLTARFGTSSAPTAPPSVS